MIGNNSCGVHALMGGKTVDNIDSMRVLLYDGTILEVGATSDVDSKPSSLLVVARGKSTPPCEHPRPLRHTHSRNAIQKFLAAFPATTSTICFRKMAFNVARALVGSEGTCVTVLDATLRLMPSPPCRILVGLGFFDAYIAADNVPFVLQHKPIGLEGFDGLLVEFMRRKRLVENDLQLLPDGNGHLLVEFGGDTLDDAQAQATAMIEATKKISPAPHARQYSQSEAERVWKVRESGPRCHRLRSWRTAWLGGLGGFRRSPGEMGSICASYLPVAKRYDYRPPIYGHFGQGCVHMRFNFDLESEAGIAKYCSSSMKLPTS